MEESTKSLFIIINAGYADDVIKITRQHGAKGATILNARGSAPQNQVFMGITIDKEKEIVLCLTSEDIANKIMLSVKEELGIGTAAHGVCFTLPVERVVGINKSDSGE